MAKSSQGSHLLLLMFNSVYLYVVFLPNIFVMLKK
jgi:hypothetical protein